MRLGVIFDFQGDQQEREMHSRSGSFSLSLRKSLRALSQIWPLAARAYKWHHKQVVDLKIAENSIFSIK
jgi:hypothetical protein